MRRAGFPPPVPDSALPAPSTRVTTRLSRCLALGPAPCSPRPFRPSLPSALSLGGSGGGGGSRSSLAHYIKGRRGRTGRLELQPVAAAAAWGAATGGGFPPGRGAGNAPRTPRGSWLFFFFFFLKGDSRGFELREDCPLPPLPAPLYFRIRFCFTIFPSQPPRLAVACLGHPPVFWFLFIFFFPFGFVF